MKCRFNCHILSFDGSFEACICLVHVKGEFSDLLCAEFLCRPHLVQRDQPLNYLSSVREIAISDFVDGLDHIAKERMQSVFGHHSDLEGVQKGNKILCRCYDQSC